MNNLLKTAALLLVVLALAACNSTTVLNAAFNAEPVGTPPAATQPIGFIELRPGSGTITMAPSPTGSGNPWVRFNHPTQPAPETVMRARFDSFHGTGKYNVLCAMFIPSDTGAVTVNLETFAGSIDTAGDFLHLDFMPENNVRINDDNANRFGSFPRNQSFVLSIAVDTTVNPPTARVALLGGSASGQKDVTLPAFSTGFGAVRVWMGFQWTGPFFIDDLLVTRVNP
jgi:hypothetical protein